MDALGLFLSNLGVVAKSPYAFIAYLALVTAWTAILFRVKRNKQLLRRITNLPEEDRLKALRYEMGSVLPVQDLSPDQFLRYVQKRYLFLGSILLIVVVAGLLVTSWYFASRGPLGTIGIDVTEPTASEHPK
jgi:hypothetical protein